MERSTRLILRVCSSLACLFGLLAASANRQPVAFAENFPAKDISFGSTTPGSIVQPGEVNTYTFSTQSGDKILIGMSRVSGDLWPRIRLYGPDGELLRDEEASIHVEVSFEVPDMVYVYLPIVRNKNPSGSMNNVLIPGSTLAVTIAAPGTYTLLISDGFDGTLTGSYNLFLQKLNPPAGAGEIEYSQTLPGSIDQPAEMDAFTFLAAAGDRLIAGMSRVSGDLWQQIRLYDPRGELLREEKEAIHSEFIYNLPVTGNYTLLISDGFRGTNTGGYNVFIQRTIHPINSVAIAFGQTAPGFINQPAEMDAFTFNASANDQVQINMTRISGDLWQQIRLYDPAGVLLGENKNATQAEMTQVLTTSGEYTILASDGFRGTNTGGYNIHLQKLP